MSPRLIQPLACLGVLALAPPAASAQIGASSPDPVFVEDFAVKPAAHARSLDRWVISPRLAPELRPLRVGIVTEPIGKTVGRVALEEGDALEGASAAVR